jgi:hypothetical protein
VYPAELLPLEPRPVIRHPDIYRTQRVAVMTAPAARSRPDYLQGEPRRIAVPGDEQINWTAVAVIAAVLSLALTYVFG